MEGMYFAHGADINLGAKLQTVVGETVTPRRDEQTLTPRTSKWDLILNKGLCRCNSGKGSREEIILDWGRG